MDRPTPADEFRRAVAVAIADAPIRLAHDEAECDAWAGYAQFTNGLHAVTSLPRQLPGQSRPTSSQCLLLRPWLGSTSESNDRWSRAQCLPVHRRAIKLS
jgi:hypothetical protein